MLLQVAKGWETFLVAVPVVVVDVVVDVVGMRRLLRAPREVALGDSNEFEDNNLDFVGENEAEGDAILAKDGTAFVSWNKIEGRIWIRSYIEAEFKMENYTEKKEINYLE